MTADLRQLLKTSSTFLARKKSKIFQFNRFCPLACLTMTEIFVCLINQGASSGINLLVKSQSQIYLKNVLIMGGTVASRLVCSSLDRMV